jgi:hypothetical protein
MNTTEFFQKCDIELEKIKTQYNIDNVYYGSGYPVQKPCIIVNYKDAFQGEMGYNVLVYPQGEGYGKPYDFISIDSTKFN